MKPHVAAGLVSGTAMTVALVASYLFKVWTKGVTPLRSDIVLLGQTVLLTGVLVGGIVALAMWWARR